MDVNQLRGVTDKGVGLGKEFFGVLLGNDRLQQEGEAQQDRASKELKAFREQLRAQKLEAKADGYETKERLAQQAKSGSSSDRLERKDKPGPTEAIKGKLKEAIGGITDNEELKREGEAQRQKGSADTEAQVAKAKAKGYEAQAKEAELEQRAASKN